MSFLTGFWGWRPSKMPAAKEEHTMVWLWVVKMFMVIPVAIAAFSAKDLYNLVLHHHELQKPPYNKRVLLAQELVYVGCMTLFPWLFISSGLIFFQRRSWLFVYGLVDFGLALTIIIGVAWQDKYLPGSTKSCGSGMAERWQRSSGHLSLFSQAAAYNNKDTALGKCKDFVSSWELAVCVAVFQMFASYIGIFFDEREFSILNPYRPLFYFILAILGPPYYFHHNITPKIRFTYFYVVKLIRRTRGLEKLSFEKAEPYVPRYESMIVPNAKLQQVLNIEHVLLNIVEYSHHEDIINLSLASKAVREAVYPGRDLAHRVPKLKKYCCEKDSKKGCLYCNKRICKDCKLKPFLPSIPGQRHVTSCVPYCSKCYYEEFSRHQRGYKKPCICRPMDISFQSQDVCRTCSRSPRPNMVKDRQKRYQQEARDIAFGIHLPPGEKPKCAKCLKVFQSGTRWWKCKKCSGECRDNIHPPFVGKRKELDVEKAERAAAENEETGFVKWLPFLRNR
ncbi:uncharacterized protein BDR25DRAFT_119377 [Lindgomyces ingoldianus]|uniref:Uncharacterized protein n=1 Tax=Lindgomyces ingoldianus TaxID=673940 RepID=A0ACB6R5M2_9PLEO|nr:uncharacterized protein BDR25DRAFT_119377 [Lindgomyces ingoldianus]KAF2474143.1 hypothetical protein BDR25DRAFT_119377 [Lindgomyces ingoldianus]